MGKRLTDDQVIDGLMSAPTKSAAASRLGMSRRALYDRLADPAFQSRLADAVRKDAERHQQLRESATGAALEALVSIMEDKEPDPWGLGFGASTRDKLKAAEILLSYASRCEVAQQQTAKQPVKRR